MNESKYLKDNKILMKEWNWDKNNYIDPSILTIGSNKKVWWICNKGHEWQARINKRVNGNKCPYCSNHSVLKGYNDLATTNPILAKEWNYEKNNGLKPSDVFSSSNKKVWWKCDKGHEWQASIDKRENGSGCPYCSNHAVLKGYNDLETTNPILATEWNYEKNNGLKPSEVLGNSNKKVWWKCSKGHEWQATIDSRNRLKGGCPYCSNHAVLKGYNDLAATNPILAKEWNYEKNNELKPSDVSSGSHKKVWWKCSKGHEWQANIDSRSNLKRGCPYCSNQKVLIGYNDLVTTNPYLASEWDYKKNGNLKPSDVSSGSQKMVWWKCNKGHEWKATISKRNRENCNCPICGSERKTSVSEKSVLYYVKKYYNGEIISNYRSEIIQNKELDIYIKDLKIGIEYDGIFYHKNKKRDKEKDKICNNVGIKVYHIIENNDKNLIKDNNIYYIINNKYLEWAIKELLTILFKKQNYDIDLQRDQIDIYNLINYYEKEQSLSNKFPNLAKEWNYEKNGKLRPEFVSFGSSKKVWWKCDKGHEWQSSVSSRVNGTGCPYCSNNKVLSGYNDLKTKKPELIKEWNWEKNKNINPNYIAANSNKKVWWKCDKGHEWQAKIQNRNLGGKCPYCSNQKVLGGYNDLETTNPILAEEWNYEKNKGLKPSEVFSGSNKKVWWICNKGHEWQARITDRNSGSGCPYCSNHKLLKGYNDLETTNPILAKEWNYEKNNGLKPSEVFSGSNKKVWWKCDKGHEWEARIADRNSGKCCPFCQNNIK